MSKRTFAVILTLLCSFCIGQALAGLLQTQRPSGSELSLYDIDPVTP
ncbi:hypothetical protein LP675_30550, partial [Escherichia coli]|nr:hypothetical protein [Escherichia coli]